MLWLPPKVWFHGSQSSSTGGSLAMNGIDCRSIAALLQHMRWVVITALGCPVEPEVSRNRTMVSAPVARWASSTRRGVIAARAIASVETAGRRSARRRRFRDRAGTSASARAKRGVSNAATSPGVSRSMT